MQTNPTEIAAQFIPQADITVGCLAVFRDYKGRDIGGRVTRIEDGLAWCRVIGDQAPYRNADTFARELSEVRPAF